MTGNLGPTRSFQSRLAEFAYLLALDRGEESNGDRRAPSGWFSLVDLVSSTGRQLSRRHITDASALGLSMGQIDGLAYLLVQDRASESVCVSCYVDAGMASDTYEQLEDVYARWLMDQKGIVWRDLKSD